MITLQGMAPLLQVYDMPTSLRFYCDLLDFQVIQDSGNGNESDWVLMKRDGIELMLNTAYEKPFRPTQADSKRIETHQDITLYFGCPNINDMYNQLIDRGLSINKPQTTGYGWKAITFTDPDGYGLCFHWPEKDN